MVITINGKEVEVLEGETLIEVARRIGFEIPSMCYAKGAKHKSSCMVCVVRDSVSGRMLPSCSTYPTEGMCIETDCEEVLRLRSLSLELLLSDHRADCEAPCSIVCPKGLDVERVLYLYDAARHAEARALLASVFSLPEVGCDNCKAPCEKACRRGTVDRAVEIRAIIKELASREDLPVKELVESKPDKAGFISRMGRFTSKEKEWLKETVTAPSRCLHCACPGRSDCKLRRHATAAGIKRPRYEASSLLPVKARIHVKGRMWFEPAKCIRCGLCVYNSEDGFTFKNRGFGMQVVIPEESRVNVSEELAGLCPTGALYLMD